MEKYLDDILVLFGCGLIIYATYLLSIVGAIYAAGIIFVLLGVVYGLGSNNVNPKN